MKLTKYKIAIIGLILANIIWGASAPIFKWSMQSIGPMELGFLRFSLASLLLLPFVVHRLQVSRRDLLRLFFLGFIGFGLNIGLTLFGLKLAPSINAPVIGSAVPVFLLLGSIVFLKEKAKSKAIIGTLMGLVGVLIIVIEPLLRTGFDSAVIGNLLFVLSNFALIAYTLLLKKFDFKYPSLTVTFWLFAFAALNFLIFIPIFGGDLGFVTTLDAKALVGIVFGTIFTSTIAYVGYNYAVQHVPANEVGVFLYIDPVIAALIAIPLLNEQITVSYILGTILVFVGIFIAEGRIHFHPIHKLRG